MPTKKKAPVFAISISDTDQKTGVNLISFVSRPAIEADFVALSAQGVKLAQDKHKQILTGPVLIPDRQIFRLDADTQEPFYIQFDAPTIEQIRNKFFKNNFTHATNDEHELALDGNYVVESWIIEDPEKDKAVALGLSDLPKGTWMVSYHVPDTDYWEKEILSGNKRGFSLEGFFNYEEVKEQLSKMDMPKANTTATTKPGFMARMKAAIMGVFLSVMALADGTSIEVDDETKEVFKLDTDGNRTEPLADGSYELADGATIEVVDGKLKEASEEEEEEMAATDLTEGSYNLPGGDVLTVSAESYSIAKPDGSEDMKAAEVEALKAAHAAELKAKSDEIAKLSATVEAQKVQLSKKPAAAPVKLGGDKDKNEQPVSLAAQRLAELRDRNKKK